MRGEGRQLEAACTISQEFSTRMPRKGEWRDWTLLMFASFALYSASSGKPQQTLDFLRVLFDKPVVEHGQVG